MLISIRDKTKNNGKEFFVWFTGKLLILENNKIT